MRVSRPVAPAVSVSPLIHGATAVDGGNQSAGGPVGTGPGRMARLESRYPRAAVMTALYPENGTTCTLVLFSGRIDAESSACAKLPSPAPRQHRANAPAGTEPAESP